MFMVDPSKLSVYQHPEGTLKEWKTWAPRTNLRDSMIPWKHVRGRSVLDIGCNAGKYTIEAMRQGATRAVGVDVGGCIPGARELAKEAGVGAEFWQVNLESKEFRRLCPTFDVVFFFSVLTHLKDREGFLDWLDGHVRTALIFESNHGEKNKQHIDLVQKHMWFDRVTYLGRSDIPEKPHHLWLCERVSHEVRYPLIRSFEVEFIPMSEIVDMDEEILMNQKSSYPVDSKKFLVLREDIRARGIREPFLLKKKRNGKYAIANGGHRYLAAKQLGYVSIPAKVIPYHLEPPKQ